MAALPPYNSANLKAEIKNDPKNMGYAPLVASGAIGGLAALINSLDSPGAGAVPHEPISGSDFLALIDANELDALTIGQKQDVEIYTSAAQVHIGDAAFQAWALNAFTVGNCPNSHAALSDKATRQGSRAEILWGTGTNVSSTDLQDASPFV